MKKLKKKTSIILIHFSYTEEIAVTGHFNEICSISSGIKEQVLSKGNLSQKFIALDFEWEVWRNSMIDITRETKMRATQAAYEN